MTLFPANGAVPPPDATPPAPGEPWTVLRMILWSAGYLADKGVPRARLDAEHLLASALETDRLRLYLQFDRPLEAAELERFRPLLKRRAAREPLQYIHGRAAFRDLDVRVDPRVLVPRPETEGLVQLVLDWCGEQGRQRLSAWDVGTGSGVIAISLATEGGFERVLGSDRSEASVDLARENGIEAGAAVEWRVGALFDPLEAGERFDVVVSNPPYVRSTEAEGLEPEVVEWEPSGALFAGEDGMSVIEPLVLGAVGALERGGLLAVEIGAEQGDAARAVAERASGLEDVRVVRDLSGRDRYLLARRS